MLPEAITAHITGSSVTQGGDNIIPCGLFFGFEVHMAALEAIHQNWDKNIEAFLNMENIDEDIKDWVWRRWQGCEEATVMLELLGYDSRWVKEEIKKLETHVSSFLFSCKVLKFPS